MPGFFNMSNFKAQLPVNLGVSVRKFMEAAGDSTDRLNVRQFTRYTGMQCEELAEKLALLGGGTDLASRAIAAFAVTLDEMGKQFKDGLLDVPVAQVLVNDAIRADAVDADIDLAWVSFGSLNSIGADVNECVQSVAIANLSKIGPDGVVLRAENGKIKKPEGWTEPDHLPNLFPVPVVAGEIVTPEAKGRVSRLGDL